MVARIEHLLTPDEYLALEREAEEKSEYCDGIMYAGSGASEAHNLIAMNVGAELHARLRKRPCKVYPGDMKVRVPDGSRYFYPDLSVVCGEAKFADERRDVLLNPIILIAVLSESTAAFDRGKKFQAYQQIDSLREYLLIEQDDAVVERFVRREDGSWIYTRIAGIDATLTLDAIDCQLQLAEIYAKTGIGEPAATPDESTLTDN